MLDQISGVTKDAPLFLIGHSRGCKTCVAAAAVASENRRRVAGLVLFDPVDATEPDPFTVLPLLEGLKGSIPTAVLGSTKSSYDCAPSGANYERFAEALGRSSTPGLVGSLRRAGHMQFLDDRRRLSVDVCTAGKDKDEAVREAAYATAAAWARACLQEDPKLRRDALRDAARALEAKDFRAAVEWRNLTGV